MRSKNSCSDTPTGSFSASPRALSSATRRSGSRLTPYTSSPPASPIAMKQMSWGLMNDETSRKGRSRSRRMKSALASASPSRWSAVRYVKPISSGDIPGGRCTLPP